LESYDYRWGNHIAPHDIKVRELGTGLSRLEKAHQLGITFTVAPNLSLEDGIEAVRSTLPKMYIDEKRCTKLVKALESYHYEFDAKRNVYSLKPVHCNYSHIADALRMLAVSLPSLKQPTTPEELERRYYETRYGTQRLNDPFYGPHF